MTQTMGIHTQLQALYPGLTLSVGRLPFVSQKLFPTKFFFFLPPESMETLGDKVLDVALSKVGEKSLFTKELEGELLDGRSVAKSKKEKSKKKVSPETLFFLAFQRAPGGPFAQGPADDAASGSCYCGHV
jgi:hypothetical protein